MRRVAVACGLALALLASAAHAHKSSDSYLALEVKGAAISGTWDIALRDLELAIGLDVDSDGAITWGELRAQEPALSAYALSHLRLAAGGERCSARVAALRAARHTDGGYASLSIRGVCPREIGALELDYHLLFALDPQHRGLLRLTRGGDTTAAVLSPSAPRFATGAEAPHALAALRDYGREGVFHIWLGSDHLLFLLCLLLPAVLRRGPGGWRPVERARSALSDVVRVVTAFTLSHSLTLALAVLGAIDLPSRLVESLIAASVLLAALDNLRPFLRAPRWAIALGFGLVHGLGFASVLAGLGLPPGARALALLGFNLGVELGQLAIVAAFLPLALMLRRGALYPRVVLAGGSAAVAALAGVWLWERALCA
jgi:hypothetical protein